MEFASDPLEHGRRIKRLTIVDVFWREAVDFVVDHGIPAQSLTRVLDSIARFGPLPRGLWTGLGGGSTSGRTNAISNCA
jgi:putative transposase